MAPPSDSQNRTYPQGSDQPDRTQPLSPPPQTAADMDATAVLERPLQAVTQAEPSKRFTFIKGLTRGRTTMHQDGGPKLLKPAVLDRALTIGWAIAATALTVVNPYALQRLERQGQTALLELRGTSPVPEDILILAIDDSSLNANEFYSQDPETYASLAPIQSWPWERRAYGEAIERLMGAGARAIAVDVTFSVPSSYGEADDEALTSALQRYPGKVVLAEQYSEDDSDQGATTQYQRPRPEFLEAGARTGLINFILEPDGRIHQLGREAIIQKRKDDQLLDSLLTSGDLELSNSLAASLLEAAEIDYPEPRGSNIFFHGPAQTFQQIPFWKVLDESGWQSLKNSGIDFNNKIILIGGTAGILQDLHAVPFGGTVKHRQPMAGVEVQANAVATLWQDRALADWGKISPWNRGGLVLALVLGTSWLMSRPNQLTNRLVLGAMLGLGWLGLSFGSLVLGQMLLPLAMPLLAIAGFSGAQVVTVGVREQVRKQRLRSMLKSHASVPAVREILSQQEEFQDLLAERESEVIGKLLSNRYQVIRLLGTGGFSETYIAQDRQRPSSPPCVVKQLRFLQGGKKMQLMRRLFASEAETLEKLGQHDQIPQLLAYFEEEYEFYLVQELIMGQSLHTELLHRARLSIISVVQLLHDLLNILDFVHAHHIIHRDIKPNNIIRRRTDEKYVLIDFGIAKTLAASLDSDTNAQLTVAIGTQGYIPREQIAGRPSFNSDLYALGTTAIECLTGLIPRQFKYDEAGEIIWAHRASQLSPELLKVLRQLVRCDSLERYGSAQEALADLVNVPEFLAFKQGEMGFSDAQALEKFSDFDEEDEGDEAIADTRLWNRDE